jgi:hypothetical protein
MLGKADAVSILIEPPEAMRDAPIEQIRRGLYPQREQIMEAIAQTIKRVFTSEVRNIDSIQEAVHNNEMDAAAQFAAKLKLATSRDIQ